MNCAFCDKKIHWCALAQKFFHDHNYMTFCTDAFGRTKAKPRTLWQKIRRMIWS